MLHRLSSGHRLPATAAVRHASVHARSAFCRAADFRPVAPANFNGGIDSPSGMQAKFRAYALTIRAGYLYWRAQRCYGRSEFRRATDFMRRALALLPQREESLPTRAYFRRALALFLMEAGELEIAEVEADQAIREYEVVIRSDPFFTPHFAYIVGASVKADLGRWSQASNYARLAVIWLAKMEDLVRRFDPEALAILRLLATAAAKNEDADVFQIASLRSLIESSCLQAAVEIFVRLARELENPTA